MYLNNNILYLLRVLTYLYIALTRILFHSPEVRRTALLAGKPFDKHHLGWDKTRERQLPHSAQLQPEGQQNDLEHLDVLHATQMQVHVFKTKNNKWNGNSP